MLYGDLFIWWAISISWSIVFLIGVSIYLYRNSKKRVGESSQTKASTVAVLSNFVFIWVLIGLLTLYIVSIHMGSSLLFAAGNIAVEVILIVYAIVGGTKKSG
jgi:uncharacterized membrane protein